MSPEQKKPEKGKAILAETLEDDDVSVPQGTGWESELENEPKGQLDDDLIENSGAMHMHLNTKKNLTTNF